MKVMATSRETYKNFFEHETSEPGKAIFDQLWNKFIFAWYYCLLDVVLLTGMNVLLQASLPLPHLLFPKISSAKQALIGMVGTGNVLRTKIMPVEAVNEDTSFGAFGAYANKYMDVDGWSFADLEKIDVKRDWHKLYVHCLNEIDQRFSPENMVVFKLFQVLDSSVVHGPTRRQLIGAADLAVSVTDTVK